MFLRSSWLHTREKDSHSVVAALTAKCNKLQRNLHSVEKFLVSPCSALLAVPVFHCGGGGGGAAVAVAVAGDAASSIPFSDGLPALVKIDANAFYHFKGNITMSGDCPLLARIGANALSSRHYSNWTSKPGDAAESGEVFASVPTVSMTDPGTIKQPRTESNSTCEVIS